MLPEIIAHDWRCPACDRAFGDGCGRDDKTPRVGCYLLGGPSPAQTTDPALCEHDFEGAVDGRCRHCRIHYFHLPALTPGCSCGNPVYGHDASDPEIRIIDGVMVTGPKS